MKVITNHFWTFIGLSLLLFVGVSAAFGKLLSFVIAQNIYRCQTFFQSLSIEIFPYHLRDILFVGVGLLLFLLVVRTCFLVFRIYSLKKRIQTQLVSPGILKKLFKKYQLEDKVFLLRSSKSFAFCFGVRHPKIYISLNTVQQMTRRELEAILLHERYHLEQGDSLQLFVSFFVQMLFPLFPVVSDVLHKYRIEREIKADQASISGLGESLPLKSALKKMLLLPSQSFIMSSAIADDSLELRIKMLVSGTRPGKAISWLHVLISLFFTVVLIFVLAIPVKAVGVPRYDQKEIVVCLNGTSCQTVCSVGNHASGPLSTKQQERNASFLYSPVPDFIKTTERYRK